MQYRREIDGLRAIAVLPVMLFHAGIGVFSGGYVGVDVFFVISGYLITATILSELDRGRFSILTFYDRRARRILPALSVVVLFCIPMAWLSMFPGQLREFFYSIPAVSLFVSNIFFWQQSGYFASAAEEKPLLHTWSLAVEEQFYLFFPVVMILCWRFGRRPIFYGMIVVALLSLVLAEWGARVKPSANFYLLPSRVWELLAGSICAFWLMSARRPAPNDALALLGLGLITGAILLLDAQTPFPSLYALAPVAGASLIILYAGGDGWADRILRWRPFVAVGLISYSAYLWHQPLFAFARLLMIDHPPMALILGLVLLTLGLAALSWRFVEQPFRRAPVAERRPTGQVLALAASVLVAFAALGALGSQSARTQNTLMVEKTAGACNADREACYAPHGSRFKVAMWGDSFADAFAISLGERLNGQGIDLHLYIKRSCPSLMGTRRKDATRLGATFEADCAAHNAAALKAIQALAPDYVILNNAYEWYMTAQNPDGERILMDADTPARPNAEFMPARLSQTIAALNKAGSRVVVLTPHPTVQDERDYLALRKRMLLAPGRKVTIPPVAAIRTRDLLLSGLAEGAAPVVVDGLALFCDGPTDCPVKNQAGQLVLYDGQHISTALAPQAAALVTAAIEADRSNRAPATQ